VAWPDEAGEARGYLEETQLPYKRLQYVNKEKDKPEPGKAALKAFALHTLQPEFVTHPLIEELLADGLQALLDELDTLPDTGDIAPPNFDNYVSKPLRNANGRAAEAYFTALSKYSDTVARGSEDEQKISLEEVTKRHAILLKANENAEPRIKLYNDKVAEWEAKRGDRAEEYEKKLKTLRERLNGMVTTFNQRSKYDEPIEADDIQNFLHFDYKEYRPAKSFWNDAANGTLYYVFTNNHFQLHIHCAQNAAKADAVRIKRNGEQKGVKADGAWGLVEYFMQTYQPNWTGVPRDCAGP
jgi:hypothetical protein